MKVYVSTVVESAKGQNCSGLYDLASESFRLNWREIYNDADEAEFFGNQAEEGQLLGIFCEGVASFESSIDDHVFVGTLLEMRVERSLEGHKFFLQYESEAAGAQCITFTCKASRAEKFDGGRIVRIPLNPECD